MVSPELAEEEVDTLYRAALRERGDTILRIAATAKQTSLVHNLVKHFEKSDLELLNDEKNTAFCFATVSGVVAIAKVMYEKNNNLPTIQSSLEKTPLEMAILLRKRKMVEYLYPITPRKDLKPEEIRDVFLATIHADMYGANKDLITLLDNGKKNNIMHLAGEIAPPSRLTIVTGAALQMQRELLWFKVRN
ncbi:Hypothetical predicted protein [Olea europaea subsp. europaea]|uniref:Uncharacterized protein n=1 Tax=Olea europaea subsp. europaea TaxID=158383 RepID=A0A8S0PNP1_OLEEU|nr:Hypothetical predicted protein [Olea europaea subsp. europaea]